MLPWMTLIMHLRSTIIAILKVDASGLSRQETTEEYLEKNTGEGDGKAKNKLDRNAEKSSRSEQEEEEE